ncbi:winged helix-turn-helix domain-containing protein [Tistrella bauzanensis]
MSHLRRKLQDYGADDTLFETVRGIGYRVRQD